MSDDAELTKHDHVLMGLVFSLQHAAMTQLGKLQDPASGGVYRDLDQARATIDILEMLKVKCRTGTPVELVRMLDQAVLNLQLNYMDELKRPGDDGRDASVGRGEGPDEAGITKSDTAGDKDAAAADAGPGA
ncbi:MAG: DUF1844 domain-containing protein [bacterium]|nr:DUF1844 domain-containing protein [bacterium]